MIVDAAVLAAANRVMHMDYPDELEPLERYLRFSQDAQLVAGAVALAAAEPQS